MKSPTLLVILFWLFLVTACDRSESAGIDRTVKSGPLPVTNGVIDGTSPGLSKERTDIVPFGRGKYLESLNEHGFIHDDNVDLYKSSLVGTPVFREEVKTLRLLQSDRFSEKLAALARHYKRPANYTEAQKLAASIVVAAERSTITLGRYLTELKAAIEKDYKREECQCLGCCSHELSILVILSMETVRAGLVERGVDSRKQQLSKLIEEYRKACDGNGSYVTGQKSLMRGLGRATDEEVLKIMKDENEQDCVRKEMFDIYLNDRTLIDYDYKLLAEIIERELAIGKERITGKILANLMYKCRGSNMKKFYEYGQKVIESVTIIGYIRFLSCYVEIDYTVHDDVDRYIKKMIKHKSKFVSLEAHTLEQQMKYLKMNIERDDAPPIDNRKETAPGTR